MIFDWLRCISKSTANNPGPDAIRLNLGCGDKKLKGYVNVDIAESRKGVVPDILCDIQKTIFEDNYADEVLSVHTIEHFYYWEAKAVILEWRRILKPGGKLILECPNLLQAARAFTKNPSRASLPGKEGQMTMWVFYGDPSWKDPLMCHKWGYTPQSLIALLKECGLVNVRQEKALFKKREPRDMRVTAVKPKELSNAS